MARESIICFSSKESRNFAAKKAECREKSSGLRLKQLF
jgi:hypothetical protein